MDFTNIVTINSSTIYRGCSRKLLVAGLSRKQIFNIALQVLLQIAVLLAGFSQRYNHFVFFISKRSFFFQGLKSKKYVISLPQSQMLYIIVLIKERCHFTPIFLYVAKYKEDNNTQAYLNPLQFGLKGQRFCYNLIIMLT